MRHAKGDDYPATVTPEQRFDWMGRYRTAMEAPEDSPELSRAK
jgi:hypothetical protein